MQYRRLGGSGPEVSVFCIGTSLFGEVTPEPEAARILGAAREAGINFVDTAPSYAGGRAEEILGRLLARQRGEWIVATKVSAGNSPGREEGLGREWMMRSIERSLKRLDTDCVDIFYLHRHDGRVPLEETVAAMGDIIRAGKARHFGFSNYAGWQIAEIIRLCDACGTPRPVVAQPYYNIVTRMPEVDYLPACAYFGIGVVPYSPLARGVLTGKYAPDSAPPADSRAGRGDRRMLESAFLPEALAAAWKVKTQAEARGMSTADFAINWLLNHRAVSSVLVGAKTREQLPAYLTALNHVLIAGDEQFVDALVAPGHPATAGYNDPQYPVTGRMVAVT